MKITLNGEVAEVHDAASVADVVAGLVKDPSATAVACNGEVVPRSTWPDRELEPSDAIEVVTAAQGG